MSIRSNKPVSILTATYAANKHKDDNKALVLNVAAGTAVSLAEATGSGWKARFVVGTASNANVISATAGSTFVGGYLQATSGDSSLAADNFMEAVAGDNTLSPTTAGGGGLVGDWVQFEDIAADVWLVTGAFQGVADPTTRFSTV